MTKKIRPNFKAGKNLAIKVPRHKYQSTISFYKEIIGLNIIKEEYNSVAFEFGEMYLWVDKSD
jgi:catechol-2,3-dioxygenase